MKRILLPLILTMCGYAHAAEDNANVLLIGVRSGSIPLSYKDGTEYKGLAVDLCMQVFEEVKKTKPALTYKLVEVSSSTRIPFLKEGRIDMECGSTTNSPSRRKEVAFSVPYFISSITGMTLSNSIIDYMRDIPDGSNVIYTKGTTTEDAVRRFDVSFNERSKLNLVTKLVGEDHQVSFDQVTQGKAMMFLNDNILLTGLITSSPHPEKYRLIKQVFSIEPYGVMTRLDDLKLQGIINKVIIKSMQDGSFNKLYDKWFMQPIPPKGSNLNIPMSRALRDVVHFPTTVVGN